MTIGNAIQLRWLAVGGFLIGVAAIPLWPQAKQGPEARIGKFSFGFDISRTEYHDESFVRGEYEELFLGGDFAKTTIEGEYQYTAHMRYQFTRRFSTGMSLGHTETSLQNPLVFSSPALFNRFNPLARTVIECGPDIFGETEGCHDLIPQDSVDPPNSVFPVIKQTVELNEDNFKGITALHDIALSGKLGDLTQIPIMFTARYDLMLKTRWRPWVSVGIGYTLNSYKDDNSLAHKLQEIVDSVYNTDGRMGPDAKTGTQFLCDYLSPVNPDPYLICTGFHRSDGSVVPGLIYGAEEGAGPYFIQGVEEIAEVNWETQVDDSITWGFQGGFDWTLSRRWDFVGAVGFTWYDKQVRSTFNGKTGTTFFVYPKFCEWIDEDDNGMNDLDCDPKGPDGEFFTGDEDVYMMDGYGGSEVKHVRLDSWLHFMRIEPPKIRLDVWHFSAGVRYTFGR
jgi:hypothetical protein